MAGTKQLIRALRGRRVLIAGDAMLDRYVAGDAERISPEAPVPIIRVRHERDLPGGAANVACNVRALGGKAELCALVGDDPEGERLLGLLREQGIGTGSVLRTGRASTVVKTRVMARHQQVVRIDRELPVETDVGEELAELAGEACGGADVIVIQDYGKGVVGPALLGAISAQSRDVPVVVDPKESLYPEYAGAAVLKPNRREAAAFVGYAIPDAEAARRAGADMLERVGCGAVLITLGEEGMCLCERGREALLIPPVRREVFDVTGAGDTVIGVLALAMAAGADLPDAARIANAAAGETVGHEGVAVLSPEQLEAGLRDA